jgi:hypothetical protein
VSTTVLTHVIKDARAGSVLVESEGDSLFSRTVIQTVSRKEAGSDGATLFP